MKLAIFLVFVIASANTFAQKGEVVRDEVPRHSDSNAQVPNHSKEKVTRTSMQIPGTINNPDSAPISNVKLVELVKAQTKAIQTLSRKVDELEVRIRKIESRP